MPTAIKSDKGAGRPREGLQHRSLQESMAHGLRHGARREAQESNTPEVGGPTFGGPFKRQEGRLRLKRRPWRVMQ